MPPFGREGDHEAVEGASGCKNTILLAVEYDFCLFLLKQRCFLRMARSPSGTPAVRGAGAKQQHLAPIPEGAIQRTVQHAAMESAPTEIGSAIRIDRITESVGSN